jgi:hypothetical protein
LAIASPKPVPPYLRVDEPSAWVSLKQLRGHFPQNVNPAIVNFEPHLDMSRGFILFADPENHVTPFGELDGIASEIREDLPQPAGVATQSSVH